VTLVSLGGTVLGFGQLAFGLGGWWLHRAAEAWSTLLMVMGTPCNSGGVAAKPGITRGRMPASVDVCHRASHG
jgi:hypothetical protein